MVGQSFCPMVKTQILWLIQIFVMPIGAHEIRFRFVDQAGFGEPLPPKHLNQFKSHSWWSSRACLGLCLSS